MNVRPLSLGLLAAAVVAAPVAANAAGSSAPSAALVRMAGIKPAAATAGTRIATLPGGTTLQVGLVLNHSDVAAEQAAVNAIYTPGSPAYHHYFTPSSYSAEFGVAPATAQAARTWATSSGLSVSFVSANRDYLLLSGTAKQVDALFKVSLGTYSSKAGNYRASNLNPSVPSSLPIAGVLGLDSLHVSKLAMASKAQAVPKQDGCNVPGVCLGLTRPEDLWSAYDMPDDNRGKGQKVAIFGEGEVDTTIKNLRAFETFNKLRHVNIAIRSVADDFTSTDGTDEWELDTQSSTGVAPDLAEEDLYFGDNLTDASTLAVAEAWESDANAPLQASASYGECEASPGSESLPSTAANSDQAGATYEAAYEKTLMAAAAEGRTLFTSSGDTGGGCAETSLPANGLAEEPFPLAPYPAGSAYAVGVGGTILSTDHDTSTDTDPTSLDPSKGDGAKRVTELGWEYSGGGSSKFIAMPADNYQAGVVVPDPVCLLSADGSTTNTGKPCKSVPDIAAQSGDVATMNGYALSAGGSDNSQGAGTSLSSPLSVGMWARIQAAAPAVNGVYSGLGFANYDFYTHTADFYDVVAGGSTNPATPGYDTATGIGVMDVTKLMMDLDKTTAVANNFFPADTVDPLQHVCQPGGPIVDPAGDATSVAGLVSLPSAPGAATNDPGLDILSAHITQDPAAANLTFHIKVANLAGAVPPGQYFRYYFGFDGSQYFVLMSRDAAGVTDFSVTDQGALGATSTTVLTGLTGDFDDAANEVTAVVPVAAFNKSGALNPLLGVGQQLTDLSILAQRPTSVAGAPGVTLTADSADSGGCGYTLVGASSGTPTVVTTTTRKTTKTTTTGSKRKTTTGKASAGTSASQPGGTLAYTGLDSTLPLAALVLLGAGAALRRRRTRR